MDLVTSFTVLMQGFACTMTRPTLVTLQQLATGWVFAPKRTLLEIVRAGASERHHAAFHRLFASASWSIEMAGMAVLTLIMRLVDPATVFLVVDDTLVPRRGQKVFGTGMHRDPVLSSRGHRVIRWGNCWVAMAVVIESPKRPGKYFALPVLARLYLDRKSASRWRRAYRSKTELMLEMLHTVRRHAPDWKLHLLGDSAYTAPAVLARIPKDVAVTGRVVQDVRLNEPAPPRLPGTVGRPRLRGRQLPNPAQMLDEKPLARGKMKLYGGPHYWFRQATVVACFYKCPERLVRIVAIEHLRGSRGREVFYSTETDASVEAVLRWYSWRWPVEVTFHDAKQHLGIGEPQNRKPAAVERTAAMGLLLYSLIVLWHEAVRSEPAPLVRQWRGKSGASFTDMLAALRRDSLEQTWEKHLTTLDVPPGVRKLIKPLENLLTLAA